ncbi:MAG TPA: 2,3,4,5-tetrahydropyridine-2,6-dicarboxylate N-succinyltransferase [Thermoanaerobaculia bacterium]
MPSEDLARLRADVERLFTEPPAAYGPAHRDLFERFKAALNRGEIRAAEPDAGSPTGWRVNPWVKQGILAGFRMGEVVDMSVGGPPGGRLSFLDKSTYPPRPLTLADGVRVVPGGSAVRDGCYLGRGVVCMPPMYVNVGAWVGDGSMIDSHALVGSCAQVGRRVHLSAAAQLGGVLEPVGASPVIVEDDVLIGGNCGVYEGTVVKRRAVLGSGTILTRSTPVYDLVRETIHRAEGDQPLIIPEEAVVVPGSRAVSKGAGKEWGVSLYTPVIVKYRDASTDERVQLEDWLR